VTRSIAAVRKDSESLAAAVETTAQTVEEMAGR